nr:YetF domain-containing protein [Pseudooctadecabacter sp.]
MFVDHDILDSVLRGCILSALGVVWVIVMVRLIGLRTFSKMTAFDFVVTVATGSLLAGASQASDWTGFIQASTAISALLIFQSLIARARIRSQTIRQSLHNDPMLLMENGTFHEGAMRATRVTQDDLLAKLREANVTSMRDVRAVVLETTGDISVLHGDDLDDDLLTGVSRD